MPNIAKFESATFPSNGRLEPCCCCSRCGCRHHEKPRSRSTKLGRFVRRAVNVSPPQNGPTYRTGPHLKPVIGPAAKLHDASLLVEWEVLNVHLARGVVNGRGPPLHQAGVEQRCLRGQGHFEVAVGTADKLRNCKL